MGILEDTWEKLSKWMVELVDALILATNQVLVDIFDWGLQIIVSLIGWLLGQLSWWVQPFFHFMTVLLPDPTGVGFRYVFEAYKFMSAWFDFDALYYVVSMLLVLHFLTLTIKAVLFVLTWSMKLWAVVRG